MRIALFTSNRTTIPPAPHIIAASAYLTGLMADELVKRGHDVTLYAAKGSTSKAKIVDLNMPPPELDFALTPKEWVKNMNLGMKQLYLSALYKQGEAYDVIHLQTEPIYLGMPFAALTKTPTIVTNHNIFVPEEKKLLLEYPDVPIVTISHYQKQTAPELNHISTVYDGIAIEEYSYYGNDLNGGYYYFMGRIVSTKGIEEAIIACQSLGKKLIIVGRGSDEYIQTTIAPKLTETIIFESSVEKGSQQFKDLLGKARALLVPIQWEEPFGLVVVEAMASGTPVIAFGRGAIPEIMVDGQTGYIINPSDSDIRGNWTIKETGLQGLMSAMKKIDSLSDAEYAQMRQAARKRVEEKFTIPHMTDGYERVYEAVYTRR